VMRERYNPGEVEARWVDHWETQATFAIREDAPGPKYYLLEMFPYPSGRIHMGHVRNYAIGDVVARFKRMRGFNVLHPMGWDALSRRERRLQRGVHPKWTRTTAATWRQLRRLGFSYDWSRELPPRSSYHRWNRSFPSNVGTWACLPPPGSWEPVRDVDGTAMSRSKTVVMVPQRWRTANRAVVLPTTAYAEEPEDTYRLQVAGGVGHAAALDREEHRCRDPFPSPRGDVKIFRHDRHRFQPPSRPCPEHPWCRSD
jgi:hypothetical protein